MESKTILVTVSDDRSGRKDGKYGITQDKIKTIFDNNKDFGISDCKMWKWEDIIKTDYYFNQVIPEVKVEEDIIHPYGKHVFFKKGDIIPAQRLLDYIDPANNGRAYKPLVILESLKELNEGDFLIYNDCSPEIWNMDSSYQIDKNEFELEILKNLCLQNGGILTAHVKWNFKTHVNKGETGYHTHENFTTERCLNTMGMQAYKYSLQHASGFVVLQKNKKSIEFMEEWLFWNSNENCGGMGPRTEHYMWYCEVMENFKIGHRHDQSVSGLLINKMNNKIIETLDWYERPTNVHPYLFFNFCKPDFKYNFFETNQPMGPIRHQTISSRGIPVADGITDTGDKWEIKETAR